MRGSSWEEGHPSGPSVLSHQPSGIEDAAPGSEFPYQTNAATSVSPHCKAGAKAVWLLYLGAKWQTNFGPLIKDKPNICQFRLWLYLGSQFQRTKQNQDEASEGGSWLLWSIQSLLLSSHGEPEHGPRTSLHGVEARAHWQGESMKLKGRAIL